MNFFPLHRLSAKHTHRLSADSVFTHLYNSYVMGLPVVNTSLGGQYQLMCPRKYSMNFSQNPAKLIRTELVKMTSEASLLPTDLKKIHQTVYRSRRKMFPINCLRADMSCKNAFEVKTCKEELFLLANETENEMVIFTCKQNWTANGK